MISEPQPAEDDIVAYDPWPDRCTAAISQSRALRGDRRRPSILELGGARMRPRPRPPGLATFALASDDNPGHLPGELKRGID